jgi:hypothetical protein
MRICRISHYIYSSDLKGRVFLGYEGKDWVFVDYESEGLVVPSLTADLVFLLKFIYFGLI